ncbi:MAG: DUF4234 domain-containing protein [Clostridia bacterium]
MYDGERRPLSLLVIFQLISCGVFGFYWVFVVSKEMKRVHANEKIYPLVELLASILTLGIYLIFWGYKYGKLIAKAQQQAKMKPVDNAFLYAVLSAFLLFPVVMCLMQNQLNKLWTYGR